MYGGDAGRCQEGEFFFKDVVGEEVKCRMRRLRHQVRFYVFVSVWNNVTKFVCVLGGKMREREFEVKFRKK